MIPKLIGGGHKRYTIIKLLLLHLVTVLIQYKDGRVCMFVEILLSSGYITRPIDCVVITTLVVNNVILHCHPHPVAPGIKLFINKILSTSIHSWNICINVFLVPSSASFVQQVT